MKKLTKVAMLVAIASASQNVNAADLGLDSICNNNGTFAGSKAWNGNSYLLCMLPNSIQANNTIVLSKSNGTQNILWGLPIDGTVVGNGYVQNANPATVDKTVVEIEAGVNVVGTDSNSFMAFTRGTQLVAKGTSSEPVVFSSDDNGYSGKGEWGGVILSGWAESNQCPNADGVDDCIMEGVSEDFYYGGGKYLSTLSSGDLDYVVIAEGGSVTEITDQPDGDSGANSNSGDEINGLTLFAVSSTTDLDQIHIHDNLDDGIEFFGGNVNVTGLFLTCNGDDSVDWDEGYQGTITDSYIYQQDGADHAFELASNANYVLGTFSPRANGTINQSLIEFEGPAASVDVPFKLKDDTDGTFSNIKVASAYTGNCDDMSSASSDLTAGDFTNLEYSCGAVDARLASSSTAVNVPSASDIFWSNQPASCAAFPAE